MNIVRLTLLIFLVVIFVFGALFFLGLQDSTWIVQAPTSPTRYSASVAWLEVCAMYQSEPLADFTRL